MHIIHHIFTSSPVYNLSTDLSFACLISYKTYKFWQLDCVCMKSTIFLCPKFNCWFEIPCWFNIGCKFVAIESCLRLFFANFLLFICRNGSVFNSSLYVTTEMSWFWLVFITKQNFGDWNLGHIFSHFCWHFYCECTENS